MKEMKEMQIGIPLGTLNEQQQNIVREDKGTAVKADAGKNARNVRRAKETIEN